MKQDMPTRSKSFFMSVGVLSIACMTIWLFFNILWPIGVFIVDGAFYSSKDQDSSYPENCLIKQDDGDHLVSCSIRMNRLIRFSYSTTTDQWNPVSAH